MIPPLYVRRLREAERAHLQSTLRSKEAFSLRRAQYLLASAEGQIPRQIAATYGGCEQTVRNVIRAFHEEGIECLKEKSHRPKTVFPVFRETQLERLLEILHQSPRRFGKSRSTWTLGLLAEVSFEEGLTPELVSSETVRQALLRLKTSWKRAKHWITSPDPRYQLKKNGESG